MPGVVGLSFQRNINVIYWSVLTTCFVGFFYTRILRLYFSPRAVKVCVCLSVCVSVMRVCYISVFTACLQLRMTYIFSDPTTFVQLLKRARQMSPL